MVLLSLLHLDHLQPLLPVSSEVGCVGQRIGRRDGCRVSVSGRDVYTCLSDRFPTILVNRSVHQSTVLAPGSPSTMSELYSRRVWGHRKEDKEIGRLNRLTMD